MTTTQSPARPRRIEYINVDELRTADRNPRAHSTLQKVKGSIRRYGFVEAAVHDGRTGKIIAGHGRQLGLQQMKAEGEPVPEGIVEEDGAWLMPVQYGWSSANDAEAETLLVNLNRLAENGGWEHGGPDGLAAMLDELRRDFPEDFHLTGFDSADVDVMFADLAAEKFTELDPEDLDDAPARPPAKAAVSKVGDVWLLGRHRLVVGDATDPTVIRRAVAGAPVQLVFTDPPYGVNYEGQDGMKIINDNLSATELGKLLVGAFGAFKEVLIPGGTFYVCAPSGRLETTFRLALEDVGLELRQQLVWVKDSLVLSRADYHGQHETMLYGWQLDGEPAVPLHFEPDHDTLLYGWKDGSAHTFEGGRKQTTTWLFPKPKRSDLHATQKPVALVRRAILNSSQAGDERGLVLDPFGGSGTTMVACEVSHRSAALVELDPVYADVIVERMHALFGLIGVREGDGAKWTHISDGQGKSGRGGGSATSS